MVQMNKMIVNPDKFQTIVLNKTRSDLTNTNFEVDNQVIKSVSSVELLGILSLYAVLFIIFFITGTDKKI